LPKLKADLAHALDDLGKIPDYNNIDPASVSTTLDGRFMFTYNVDGQPVQVVGQLRNGTGDSSIKPPALPTPSKTAS
jgi:hypothetical protein